MPKKIRYKKFKPLKDKCPLDGLHLVKAKDVKKVLNKLIRQHGDNLWLRFDAGYEYIDVYMLKPTRGDGIKLSPDIKTYVLGR